MNTASQDLRHHLGVLRKKMLADYEQAVSYFLEEFADDARFIEQCEPDEAPHLLPVLAQVTSKAIGRPVSFDASRVFLFREHQFYHGNAAVKERVVLFFYFPEADTGVVALIPGLRGAMEITRFRVSGRLHDPRVN